MSLRIAMLLVLLQCRGPVDPGKVEASYMKYVPGAGGGKGINFTVRADSLAGFELLQFKVNGVSLSAEVRYDSGTMFLQANKFYPDKPAAVGEKPEPSKAPLYHAENYEAVIHYSWQGGRDSLLISEFAQEKSPLYP